MLTRYCYPLILLFKCFGRTYVHSKDIFISHVQLYPFPVARVFFYKGFYEEHGAISYWAVTKW